jgi:putative ABC transport system permease protein
MTGRRHLANLDDEFQDHLDRVAEELVAGGMTPEAARAEARRRFGSLALIKENTRAVWFPVWLEQRVQDLRGSVRMLRRSPGFSLVVILTLTLGIGLNAAIFSVVNAVLLKPLSYPHPERMLWLGTLSPRDSDEFATSVDVLAWREASSLQRILAYDEYNGRVTDNGTRASARIASVSEDFWAMSGARAELGGIPSGPEPAYVLSHEYFERRFASNPSVIGRSIVAGGRRAPIAAVLTPGFHVDLVPPTFSERLMPRDVDVYEVRPVRALPNGVIQIFRVVAELKPGVTIATARAELEAIRDRVEREKLGPMYRPILRVVPLKDQMVATSRPALLMLLGAVLVVLLVGCANIAALLLARASGRQRELAIRAALGAGRGRILRQLFVETLVLTAAGAGLGVLIARVFLRIAIDLVPGAVPRMADAGMDGRVLLFATALAAFSAIVFGVAPMLSPRATRSYDLLKDGVRTVSATVRRVRLRSWLVTGELALTLVLLCAAGLLVKSLARITTYPAGFAPEHVLTLTVQYEGNGGGRNERDRELDRVRRNEYVSDVLERIAATPGLEVAGMTTDRSGRNRLFVEHAPPIPDTERPVVLFSAVSAGYASAIGMRVTRGRWVTDSEPAPAYVVNESLARRVFGSDDPVGRRVQFEGPPGATEAEGAKFATIVGVVADLKYSNLARDSEPEMFADYAHAFPFVMTFVARVSGDPAAAAPVLRSLVAQGDPTQSMTDVKTVEAVLSDSIAPRRFTMFLLATFAGFALLLALIGVYGVIAYSVSLRTAELGVRMALGAGRRSVVWLVLRQGMTIAIAGLLIGVAAAAATTRVMTTQLYQVTPIDIPTFATVSMLLLVTVIAACALPALKAARVDPLVALKCE